MSGKMGEGREGRPRQSRIFRDGPRFRTAQHVDSKRAPHEVRAKEDSCSRSGERLNPVNRLGSPLDKKSPQNQKTFSAFSTTLPLLFEILTGKAVASQERAALRIGPWLQVPENRLIVD
jgi:hypothetical protein